MNEQKLYTELLKGSIIGTLPFTNYLATEISKKINSGNFSLENNANDNMMVDTFIELYGDILEDDEEEEILIQLQNLENNLISRKLLLIENRYLSHFIEMLSERREKVEIIYQDVTKRVKTVINDIRITEIKKAESLNDITLALTLKEKIIQEEKEAVSNLYIYTYPKLKLFVENTRGEDNDATEVWIKTQVEFQRKLDKYPQEVGYYEWQDSKSKFDNKASITTFFLLICHRRWLDRLKRLKRLTTRETKLSKEIWSQFGGDETKDFFEREDMSFSVRTAILTLKKVCQKILTNRYYHEEYDDVLTTIELAKETGYSTGYIDNKHQECLEELIKILNPNKSIKK